MGTKTSVSQNLRKNYALIHDYTMLWEFFDTFVLFTVYKRNDYELQDQLFSFAINVHQNILIRKLNLPNYNYFEALNDVFRMALNITHIKLKTTWEPPPI